MQRTAKSARADRAFFLTMALAMLITVIAGFGPSYFWRSSDAPPLTPLLQVHGLSATLWVLLFLAQVGLVATNRLAVHRSLGVAGVAIALGLFVTGWLISVVTRGWTDRLVFSAGALLMFAGYLLAALNQRRNPGAHKRLMLLATLSVLAPAIARLGLPFVAHNSFGPNFATLAFLVPLALYDLGTLGRLHPASMWGGLVFILMLPARMWLKAALA